MQRFIIFTLLSLFFICYSPSSGTGLLVERVDMSDCELLYSEIGLDKHICYEAFAQAYEGYHKITSKRKDIITLIDFTQPSSMERLYVIDMKSRKMLFTSHVAHGKNSGENYATSFSNKNGSHKSSLGFYITENTYQGGNGYSLILNGLEKGVNDKAKERAIVIHGAGYSNPSTIKSSGRLGRSFGCPALPEGVNDVIINLIKDGSVLYIYAGDTNYLSHSTVLSSTTADRAVM